MDHPRAGTSDVARDAFLLRIEPRVLAALRKWSEDDLRSVNAQIEFLLRQALSSAGRLPPPGDTASAPDSDKSE